MRSVVSCQTVLTHANMIWLSALICVVFVVFFHLFVYHSYSWPSYWKAIDKIPGPNDLFYFGSSLRITSLKPEDLLVAVAEETEKFGKTLRYWMGGLALVVTSDVDNIQAILSCRTNQRKALQYKMVMPWLGTGLITSSGAKWQKMRKILTPSFHFSVLRQFVEVFGKNSQIMVRLMEQDKDPENMDLREYFMHCTLDSICETAMGISLDAQRTATQNKYVQALRRYIEIAAARSLSILHFMDFPFWISSLGRESRRVLKVLHGFTDTIIKERKLVRSTRANQQEKVVEKNEYEIKKCSFLDMLLDLQQTNDITDKDIREEVDTFLFTGHDTTSVTLVWVFFELGHHLEIQEKVYQELQQIFGDSNRRPTYEDLMEMTYLKRVVMETLRLHPTVPVIGKIFDEGIQLKNYFVPANTNINILIEALHRDPEFYPDPEKFDPDRFLPQAVEKRHPFAYIPFSAGQRNCIGQRYGMLQVLAVSSALIQKFKVESLDDRKSVKSFPVGVLAPKDVLKWRLAKR